MISVLALSLGPHSAGWAFGHPDSDRPMAGSMTFGGTSHTEDELYRNAQSNILSSVLFHEPQVVAISAVADDARSAKLLYPYQVIARAIAKAKLPGAAKLIDIGEALHTFTGTNQYPSRYQADRAMLDEASRRCWLAEDDLVTERAAALAIWCHVAAQQLPELAFNPPRKRA